MKKTLLALFAILICVSLFSIDALAADDKDEIYEESLVVYSDQSYEVTASFSFQVNTTDEIIKLDIDKVEFLNLGNPSPGPSIMDMYMTNYWDLMDGWIDMIVMHIYHKYPFFPIPLCPNAIAYTLELTTANCRTSQSIVVYEKEINGTLYKVLAYPKCSDTAKCLSQYKYCLQFNPTTGELTLYKTLLARMPLYGTCPGTIIKMDYYGIYHQLNCKILCQ